MQLFLRRQRTFIPALNGLQLQRRRNTINALQAAFRDPSSPFHIPPGTQGPASPDPPSEIEDVADPLKAATQELTEAGFDPASFWEQRIVWGDQDAFQHVNNVRYMRFFESSRMQWVQSLGRKLGGQAKVDAMIKGHGVSFILKSIEVRFRRPVTFPDTLLIGYRPKTQSSKDPAVFNATASAYSLSQKTVVATSNEALVWYDYDRLEKCVPNEEIRSVIFGHTRGSS